ncbi:MAG: hypothetical protein PHD01_08585 [Geobacteraceae bacterium]|nr:hypothetical protein [Geobacteraceae bacterium]
MRVRSFILCFVVLILFCGCGGGGGSSSSVPVSTTDPETSPETEYVSFWAIDFRPEPPIYYLVSASKVAEGAHCYVYLQKDQSVTQSAIDAVKDEFDSNIYPNVRTAFGNEPNPGVDDDPKAYILLLNVLDGYSSSSRSYIAGYFDTANEYVTTHSNKKEMFYMNINPAPGIVAGDAEFNDTLAHEFQHMIHWEQKNHLKSLVDDTWLDEAMSTLAGTYCGYGPSWYSVWIYEQDPSNSLTLWASTAEDYGVVYMWAQYFKDHYTGNGNIFKMMMDQSSTGITSVNAALTAAGYGKNFTETFRDLSIAVYSGDTKTWPGHAEWSYTSIDTWPGDHDNYTLPGLFPVSRQNISDLATLQAYSMNFYQYTPATPPYGTVTWTQANAYNDASFVDSGASDITFDLISGAPNNYTAYGYLIEQQTGGSSASGGTVTYSSVVQNPLMPADVELSAIVEGRIPKSSRQILSEANESPIVNRFVAQKGKKYRIHMDSFFRDRERALRNSGARPSF